MPPGLLKRRRLQWCGVHFENCGGHCHLLLAPLLRMNCSALRSLKRISARWRVGVETQHNNNATANTTHACKISLHNTTQFKLRNDAIYTCKHVSRTPAWIQSTYVRTYVQLCVWLGRVQGLVEETITLHTSTYISLLTQHRRGERRTGYWRAVPFLNLSCG